MMYNLKLFWIGVMAGFGFDRRNCGNCDKWHSLPLSPFGKCITGVTSAPDGTTYKKFRCKYWILS